jgi:TonB family protein
MRDTPNDLKIILICGLFAFIAENAALIAVGTSQHWLAHPGSHKPEEPVFIEADVVQMPEEKTLTEEKKVQVPAPTEAVLSKVPNQGRKAKPNENQLPQDNVTQARNALPPNHGPIAVSSPAPKIPAYLQTQDLHASVVIDFYVTAQGTVTPRLVGSSGNEELDAIAISSAKQWRFSPAEKDHKPIDAKVRLRIQFDVH